MAATLALGAAAVFMAGTGCGGSAPGRDAFVSAGCGTCHTLKAAGTQGTVGPALDDRPLAFAHVVAVIRNGGADMPAYANTLTPDEIDEIATFVSRASRR